MKFLAPICLIQYVQAPLLSSLDAMGKSKDSMKATTIGVIIRILFLIILSPLKIGLWSLIISISLNVIIVTLYSFNKIKNILNL